MKLVTALERIHAAVENNIDFNHIENSTFTKEDIENMEKGLKKVGLPFENIKVFGVIKINVHILCLGEATARKWASLLSKIFPGAKINTVKHMWNAKKNNKSVMFPSMRKGYLIGVIA